MSKIVLSRKQVEQLSELMNEYTGEDRVILDVDGGSGIGYNIVAIVKYASGTREDRRDITDYELW